MTNWDLREDGSIACGPLMGWTAAVFPMSCILRLESAQSEDQLQSGDMTTLQVAMTAAQCRELAQLLLRKAGQIETQPLGTSQ